MVNIAAISAQAQIPDQLADYVRAISGLDTACAGGCLLHHGAGQAVLAAYPQPDPFDQTAIDAAVADALKLPGLERLTVLSALAPSAAPPTAERKSDFYWQLPLPLANIPAKTRNMLRRAGRDAAIDAASGWTAEHAALMAAFCQRKKDLDEGTRYLFGRLGDYLAAAPDAMLFSARWQGRLVAFAIADFSALSTCFYMFACRAADAPPGSADLLLAQILAEGEKRGHSRLNLGLGIAPGVENFKKKWGAQKFLPLLETSWQIERKKGLFPRLFGK